MSVTQPPGVSYQYPWSIQTGGQVICCDCGQLLGLVPQHPQHWLPNPPAQKSHTTAYLMDLAMARGEGKQYWHISWWTWQLGEWKEQQHSSPFLAMHHNKLKITYYCLQFYMTIQLLCKIKAIVSNILFIMVNGLNEGQIESYIATESQMRDINIFVV